MLPRKLFLVEQVLILALWSMHAHSVEQGWVNRGKSGQEEFVRDFESTGREVTSNYNFTHNAKKIELRDDQTIVRTLFLPRNNSDSGKKSEHHEFRAVEAAETNSTIQRRSDSREPPCLNPGSVRDIRRLNATKVSKNGKTLLLTRILKSRKCKKKRIQEDQMAQRRTFNLAPSLSPALTIPWMTKRGDEDGIGVEEYVEENFKDHKGRNVSPDYSRHESKIAEGDVRHAQGTHNGNKLQKLLNLFTIVQFDNGDCAFNGIKGSCLHPVQCQGKGGKPIGTCAKGFGICCYVERTCGERTKENCTYFVNEGFPQATADAPRVCTLMVEKAHSEVQQLRLEFMTFELRGPSNGTCIFDRFTVTGQNTNNIIPDMCGVNSEQHVYVDVDEAKGPFTLNVIAMGENFPRKYQIKVTQLLKNDPLIAPRNCLQYYTEPSGVVQTFNYQYNDLDNSLQAAPGYFNNLNYAVCLKKHKGFCSVSYENEERDSEREGPGFQLVNVDDEGARLLPPNQGGAEVFDCPDDYIIVNGVRLCGERLNDASIDSDFAKNYPVTDFSNGPFILQVRTNNVINGRGFSLRYRQNPCLV